MNVVRLVSHSEPSVDLQRDGISSLRDLVVYCARVSNSKSQETNENPERLLKYLIKHQHWSPFEMVNITMEIQTTRDIARQILRHRSFSFQEFSQRYADPFEDGLDMVKRECRLQDHENRQNSIENTDVDLGVEWFNVQRQVQLTTREAYKWALEQGIAKEQARALLPEGLMMSKIYMSGSLRSWIHYVTLRCGPETQAEHRNVAKSCRLKLIQLIPELKGVLLDGH